MCFSLKKGVIRVAKHLLEDRLMVCGNNCNFVLLLKSYIANVLKYKAQMCICYLTFLSVSAFCM